MSQAQTSTAHVENVSHKVVETVAEEAGVDPSDVTSSLYDVIDPDALDQIFATIATADRMEGQVTFPYNGYVVTVYGDGSVSAKKHD